MTHKEIKTHPNKRDSQRAVRRNISMPAYLDMIADSVVLKMGYGGISQYLQAKLRQDAGINAT